jgi:hypothetical protein
MQTANVVFYNTDVTPWSVIWSTRTNGRGLANQRGLYADKRRLSPRRYGFSPEARRMVFLASLNTSSIPLQCF